MLKFFALKKSDFNISGNYSGGFFNTNITNFSFLSVRLTEGTIRFVLHTNLFELHECR